MSEKSRTVALWLIAVSVFGHLVVYAVAIRYHYSEQAILRTDNWTGTIQAYNVQSYRWEAPQ